MKLIQVYKADLLNGEGLRDVYFFSGCNHQCQGCFNKETWDYDMPNAKEWTDDDFEKMIENASKPYISGITLTGGDPLFWKNQSDILKLCKEFKERLPEKTIWLYTGYTFESIMFSSDLKPLILRYIDVLCDGPFIESLKSPNKPWVGSSNQRVIDVKNSKIGDIKLLYTDYEDTTHIQKTCSCCQDS